MTDAEIKELAIKHTDDTRYKCLNMIAFAKELEAITCEKVLTELAKDNPAVAVTHHNAGVYGNVVTVRSVNKLFQAMPDNAPLYAMPPVPEGWISVNDRLPERPTEKVIVCVSRFDYAPWYMDITQYRDGKWAEHESGHSAIKHWMPLPAAPKKG